MTPGILLAVAGICLVAGIAVALRFARAWLCLTLAGCAAALGACAWVLAGGGTWELKTAFPVGGEALRLQFDGLSAFFMALISVLGGAGAAYAREYWPDSRHPHSAATGRAWWSLMLLCMGAVLVAANGLQFLVAWELFTVSAYFLITRERQRREVRAAGWLYLAASHAGTLCLFGFFALLAARTGSWALGPMRGQPELAPLFWLVLAGFGVKAGFFPLHIWLPSAHATAPSHVSAILSGAAIKMGIYGIVRFGGWLPVPAAAGWTVAAVGAASAVLGVAFALAQHDLKRLLAYHSVENIGIILLGVGFGLVAARTQAPWGQFALAGGLLHIWNHGLFKALLFLGAGSVLHATGTREMSRLGGLWQKMPWTAACFGLGAAAIAGLPPLNGFVSEWLVYLGFFDAVSARGTAAWAAIPGAVLLAVTGALALACFVKVCGVVFLGLPRSAAAERAHENGRWMRAPMLALGAACVAIGLAPLFFWPAVARATEVWGPARADAGCPASLGILGAANVAIAAVALLGAAALWRRVRRNGLRRAVTWDCGYAAPTARMQYTAGSFAATITEWFEWILCRERTARPPEGLFPRSAGRREHTPETVLDRMVRPAAAGVMAVSAAARRLQHGRLQAYILYVVLALAALGLLAAAGGVR